MIGDFEMSAWGDYLPSLPGPAAVDRVSYAWRSSVSYRSALIRRRRHPARGRPPLQPDRPQAVGRTRHPDPAGQGLGALGATMIGRPIPRSAGYDGGSGPLAWTIRERSRQQAGNHPTTRANWPRGFRPRPSTPARRPSRCRAQARAPRPGWQARQTIGGRGAGAASGSGAAVKWIGRGGDGGLCSGSSARRTTHNPGPGRRDIATIVQLTTEVTDRWSLGLALPYLYKDQNGFPRADLKLSNEGPGDVNLMVARRFGPLRATSVSLLGRTSNGNPPKRNGRSALSAPRFPMICNWESAGRAPRSCWTM